MTLRLAAIWRYPVKSLGGSSLDHASLEPRGISGDRRWMVVTPEGHFRTRRETPVMALLRADPVAGGVVLSDRAGDTLAVAEPGPGAELAVTVWGAEVIARDAGEPAAQWLTARIGRTVRLVHMPEDWVRPLDPAYAHEGDRVGFADDFPLLVTVVESLDALNLALPAPITMERFRPNLVIAGASAAFAEDGWTTLRIGAAELRLVKPCTRCVITTQDPLTGESTDKSQPFAALRALGRVMPGPRPEPIFGQNAIPSVCGEVAVGDVVEVLR